MAPKISKSECKINFNDNSLNIHNKIRGLHPKPGTYCYINNKRIKLFNTYYSHNMNKLNIGEYQYIGKILYIGCNKSSLIVKNLQFEGKGIITSEDFINIQNLKNKSFE